MAVYLDFEKPLADLEAKIQEIKDLNGSSKTPELKEEAKALQAKASSMLRDLYGNLDPWQKIQVARHPKRPHCLDYVKELIEDYTILAGDRSYGEDYSIVAGVGRFCGRSVVFLGHEKGHDTQSRMKHNFGMPRPEGYRKAVRMMDMANRFGLPVIVFVDTSGAYPGIGAEKRGQSEAIAQSIDKSLSLGVPNIAVVIGEGGSGGALALAASNRVFMLEHSVYSVASPEACSSILWRDSNRARDASQSMKITAQDALGLGVIDGIIAEPAGGAHRNPSKTIAAVGDLLEKQLRNLENSPPAHLHEARCEKFLAMGRSLAPSPVPSAQAKRRKKRKLSPSR